MAAGEDLEAPVGIAVDSREMKIMGIAAVGGALGTHRRLSLRGRVPV